jgi:hypothetical protein
MNLGDPIRHKDGREGIVRAVDDPWVIVLMDGRELCFRSSELTPVASIKCQKQGEDAEMAMIWKNILDGTPARENLQDNLPSSPF